MSETTCFRVQIAPQAGLRDGRGESLLRQAEALGITGLDRIAVSDLYFLEGKFDVAGVEHLADLLLYDPLVEEAAVAAFDGVQPDAQLHPDRQAVEVVLHSGVTDSVAESLLEGARMAGIDGLRRAATGHRYVILGRLDADTLARLSTRLPTRSSRPAL